jgi:hypothetical protein
MADLVCKPKSLEVGETRLVALIEKSLAGLQIDPASSQTTRGGTLVVANLRYPSALDARPEPDKNTHRDIVSQREERESETPPDSDDTPDTDL